MEIVYIQLDKIIPYKNNNKLHSDEQVDKLANCLSSFGPDQPIVLDDKNVIVKGTGRWLAARKLNWDTYPCYYASHLDENQIKANRIADNKVSSLDYDMDALKFEIGTLERVGFDLTLTGIGFDEMKDLLASGDPVDPSPESSSTGSGTEATSSLQLIMTKEEYETLMKDFGVVGENLGQENNYRIVRDLVDYYLANEVRA